MKTKKKFIKKWYGVDSLRIWNGHKVRVLYFSFVINTKTIGNMVQVYFSFKNV